MKTSRAIAACALAAFLGMAGCSDEPTMPSHNGDASPHTSLRHSMRKLWEDHITWTRMFIVSDVAGLPDRGPTVARLLQNQVDIGDAIKILLMSDMLSEGISRQFPDRVR